MPYLTATKYYCPKCRTSFFLPDTSNCSGELAVHCPDCGEKTAKPTSSFWFVERK